MELNRKTTPKRDPVPQSPYPDPDLGRPKACPARPSSPQRACADLQCGVWSVGCGVARGAPGDGGTGAEWRCGRRGSKGWGCGNVENRGGGRGVEGEMVLANFVISQRW
eukprot:359951-Chlamydomonas_euryale.AAC.2